MTAPVRTPLLDDQLCFDLHVAADAVVGAYTPSLNKLGLSYEQYLVLLVLWEHGDLTLGALAERLRTTIGRIVPTVRRMTMHGLVDRHDAADEADMMIAPTAKAQDLRRPVTDLHCAVRDSLGMTKEEFRGLQAILRRVAAAPPVTGTTPFLSRAGA